MESKSQQYIKEMEKNAKLFEEKLNKFKSYQTSEAYSQQDEYEEKENENEDFQISNLLKPEINLKVIKQVRLILNKMNMKKKKMKKKIFKLIKRKLKKDL